MRLAFIVDPLSSLKIWKDSSFSMMAEAAARGHELHVLMPEGVMWKGGRVIGEHMHITLSADALQRGPGDKRPWYHAAPPSESPLAEFDAVLMRQDPPFDIEYVTVTWLLEQAQREGARVFNDPRSVREIAAALLRLANDADLAESLARAGVDRAAEFSWERSARMTLEVYGG